MDYGHWFAVFDDFGWHTNTNHKAENQFAFWF